VRENTNNINPLMDVTSVNLRCNQGGLDSGSRTKTATVTAGSKVSIPFPIAWVSLIPSVLSNSHGARLDSL
jgi:hypothetical protein